LYLRIGNRCTTGSFLRTIICLFVWCIGIFVGLLCAYFMKDLHQTLIPAIAHSSSSLGSVFLFSISTLSIPVLLKHFHLPCYGAICFFSFGRGVINGFVLLCCLCFSLQSGWAIYFLLCFSSVVINAFMLHFWINCINKDADRLLPMLVFDITMIGSVILFESCVISPLLVRLF